MKLAVSVSTFSVFALGLMNASISSQAFAGQVIYENMYSGFTLVQGEGKTVDQAKKDALTALPKGWKVDADNSPVIECTRTGGVLANGTKCDDQVAGNQLRVTIPVIQTSLE